MQFPSFPLTVALAATIVALTAASQSTAHSARCSLSPLPYIRDSAATFLVGTTLSDTVLAGSGTVESSRHGGHLGPGRARAVYGQLVRVDTLDGAYATAVHHALEQRNAREVVLVPWDYDPACEPTFWSRSARWIAPGLEGFYIMRLRPDSLWAAGHPTFDAFRAAITPYPHAHFFQAGYRGTDALRSRTSLNAREMFSLYAVLPTYAAEADSASLERVRQWQSAHPELAATYPADKILEWVLRARDR